jgi:hypothetical protein
MKINFLWIGDALGKLEQLTLKSFIDNKHQPVLWLYNLKCANIPPDTIIQDARDILSENRIFAYTGNGDCRKGSYGGFSDLFRYYLLYMVGGWYCDMDITCLKNFEPLDSLPYMFRPHRFTKAVGNILKAPAGCGFLKECIESTEAQINKDNNVWVLPVKILSDCIFKNKLEQYIAPKEWFGEDNINDLKEIINLGVFTKKINLPEYAIHWCHEAISTGKWDWSVKRDFNNPLPTTLYYNLLKRHNLLR